MRADLEELTLRDVWDAVHGDAPLLGLHDAAPDCPVGQAVQRELVAINEEVHAALRSQLAETTMSEVIARTHAADQHAVSG